MIDQIFEWPGIYQGPLKSSSSSLERSEWQYVYGTKGPNEYVFKYFKDLNKHFSPSKNNLDKRINKNTY